MEPEWDSPEHLAEHFRLHGHELRTGTITEYDASAKETIDIGIAFNYRDRQTGSWRLGYYDPLTERFAAMKDDAETIVTHFRCPERYLRSLPESDYQ